MRASEDPDIFAFRSGAGWDLGPAPHEADAASGTIHVGSAALLFRGDYVRNGSDLVISWDGEQVVVHDYFAGDHRPRLVAPNGASLSDAVIEALARPEHGVQLAQAGPGPATDASAAIGRVQAMTGTASIVRNGVSVALHTGDLVYKGDVVQTDRAASLSVSFLDGTLFSVAASARLVLNDMVYQAGGADNHSLFNLVQGSLSFVAGQVAKTGDMKVGTPVATMGIRGTAVRAVIESDDGTSRLSVMTEPPSQEHPDGHTGRFDVYDAGDPNRLIGTVDDPNRALVVHPEGSGGVRVENVPKTPEEIAQENRIVREMYQAQAEAPRLPVYTGPATGGGTSSSTAPDLVLPTPVPQAVPPGLPGVQEPRDAPHDQTPPLGPAQIPDPTHSDGAGQPGGQPPDPLASFVLPGQATVTGEAGTPTGAPEAPLQTQPAAVQTANPVQVPTATGALGLSGLIVGVTQDAVLDGGAGVLAGAAAGARVIAAHAGANPDSGLDNGAVTLTGAYGTLTLRADGSYVYHADHAAFLAQGERATDSFTFTVQAGGQTATATLGVEVTGINDLPVLSAAAPVTAARAGSGRADQVGGSVAFTDPDLTDTHTASVTGAPTLTRSSGAAAPGGLAAALAGAITVGANDSTHHVDYFFSADDHTFDFLAAGESLTITYDLTVTDVHGGTAHTPLSVTVTGSGTTTGSTGSTNQPPVLDGDHMITVKAGNTVTVTSADLHASDPDNSAAQLTYTIAQDPHGYFTLSGSSGSVTSFAASEGGTAVTSFTQADIDANRVVFHHDGSVPGATPDAVTFTLTDGTNTVTGTLSVTVSSGGPTAFQDNVVRAANDQSGDLPIPTEALLFNDTGGAVAVVNVVDQAPTGSSAYVRSFSSTAVTVTGDANTHPSGAFTYAAQDGGGQSGGAATVYVNVTTGYANPTVFGQGEDDILFASRSTATTMIGGGGHDVFVFTRDYTGQSGAPTHVITDFSPADDAIDLPYLAGSPASASNINDYVRVTGTEATGYDLFVRSDTSFVNFTDVAHFTAGTVHSGDAITVMWYGHAVQVTAHLPTV